jgi:LysM repeat protein
MRLYIFAIFCLPLFLAGCGTNTQNIERADEIKNGDFILSDTNAMPGSVYELHVYVIASGDSATKIAKKFEISLNDLETLNSGLQLNRLYIGQKIRVYERDESKP